MGLWVNPDTGETRQTTCGTIHYSAKGAHIVPAYPEENRCDITKKKKNTVGILLEYGIAHGDELLTLKYGEHEEYVCKFLTSYESDNIADVENSGAAYNEFIVVAYSVVATVVPGEHFAQGDGGIEVTYLDMPSIVSDSRGRIIYPRVLVGSGDGSAAG